MTVDIGIDNVIKVDGRVIRPDRVVTVSAEELAQLLVAVGDAAEAVMGVADRLDGHSAVAQRLTAVANALADDAMGVVADMIQTVHLRVEAAPEPVATEVRIESPVSVAAVREMEAATPPTPADRQEAPELLRAVRNVVQRDAEGRIARIQQQLSDSSWRTLTVKRDWEKRFIELVETAEPSLSGAQEH